MLQRYLLFWLCLSSAIAYSWPQLVRMSGWTPPALLRDPWSPQNPYFLWVLIAVTMFAIGYMLPRDEVRQVARRWPAVLSGTAVQYTTMPLIAFAVGKLFQLSQDAMIGMIFVGCVPGAMASNVLTLNARGNTSYSVSLTTSATILSPLVVPLTLGLAFGKEIPFDRVGTAVRLGCTVVLPVIAGHMLSIIHPKWDRWARPAAAAVANLTILWIIAVVVGKYRGHLGWPAVAFLVPLLIVNFGGYLAGYGAGWGMRLPEPMRRALTLEIGMQNAGLGTVMALSLFPKQPAAAILPAAYTFGCMLTGTVLARFWAMVTERRERLAKAPSAHAADAHRSS
jgi:BASS family bile acid:Na+ symporter